MGRGGKPRQGRALRGRAGRMQNGRGSGRAGKSAVRLWGRHAVEAALTNPQRHFRKLWASREGMASLDGELPPDFPVEWAEAQDLARLGSLAMRLTRGSCWNASPSRICTFQKSLTAIRAARSLCSTR